MAQLALADQVVVDGEGLFERCVRVGKMRVVQVDAVCAQSAQALLDLLNDIAAREAGVRIEATLT